RLLRPVLLRRPARPAHRRRRLRRRGRGRGPRPGHGPARRGPQPVAVLPRPAARQLRRARPAMSTLISGGTVVTAAGPVPADVLVDGETIAAVVARDDSPERLRPEAAGRGRPGAQPPTADRVIDATGKYVLPGGIDAHT